MAAILLKVLLAVFMAAGGYVAWFIWNEYGRYRKNERVYESASRMENLVVGLVAVLSCLFMVGLLAYSGIMLFSSIAVTLPWAQ